MAHFDAKGVLRAAAISPDAFLHCTCFTVLISDLFCIYKVPYWHKICHIPGCTC